MHYKSIQISEWRQFRDINVDFHENLTILTGPNGSGKSTILSLLGLSMEMEHQEPYLATPINEKGTGRSGFSLGTLFARFNPFGKGSDYDEVREIGHSIGSISYESGERASLMAEGNDKLQYRVRLNGKVPITGFKIGSHRSYPRYQEVKTLPVSGITPKNAFTYFLDSQKHYIQGSLFHRDGRTIQNPVSPLKETLIGFAAFGADNAHMKAVPELVGLYDDFQSLLTTVLPSEIGFQKLEVRSPEIVVVSRTGEFPIDSASGGLMALIQTAWQIFLFTKAYGKKSVILMDEPENHLHPSLQRDFLGNIVRSFEDVQFIVATHSPFVITSVKESRVYALKYSDLKDERREEAFAVTAQEVQFGSKARTADKILDDVLGVSVTIPIWAEHDLINISRKFERTKLSENAISQLRAELTEAGLSEFFPEALGMIARD